jgi:hypothetical protein
MGEAKHTAGPWYAEIGELGGTTFGFGIRSDFRHPSLPDDMEMRYITSGNVYERASFTACFPPEEIVANARLIAAAPDLLEALLKIAAPPSCGCVPCVGQCRSQEALEFAIEGMREIARDAITKAGA